MPRPPLPGTVPSAVYWYRLEPLPTAASIDDALRARLADPLWMLARQWQLGELAAEDAGSPIDVSVGTEAAPLSRLRLGPPTAPVVLFDPSVAPLEAVVEAEAVLATDVGLAAEAGLHALRMLAAKGFEGLRAALCDDYPLVVPAPDDPSADRAGQHAHLLFSGAVPDARSLAAALSGPDRATVAQRLGAAEPDRGPVQVVLAEWLAWYRGLVLEPPHPSPSGAPPPVAGAAPPAWDDRRLEHRFAVSAVHSVGGVTLGAEQYQDGTLDWPDVTVEAADGLGSVFGLPEPVQRVQRLLPTAVRFPGMPARRFWEIEDASVSFAGLDPGLTDVGRVLLAEFGLVYGNDWYAVPLAVPLGTLLAVGPVTVTDTFGIPAALGRLRRFGADVGGSPARPWAVAELAAASGLPDRVRDVVTPVPGAVGSLQGEPVERVELGRDEMANLVWAVEHIVSGVAGTPVDRSAEVAAAPAPAPPDPRPAELAYVLATPAPPHWVAYAPAPVPGEPAGVTRLDRLATPGSRARVTAESAVLEEAEVPAGGVVVERAWQLTRWLDGRTVLWLGRTVRSGAGPVASGLAWDRVLPR